MYTEMEKKRLRNTISNNAHEVFVISFDEFDSVVETASNTGNSSVKEIWSKVKGTTGIGANYASATGDAFLLTRLVSDLGGVGRAYIKYYAGKPHIILKGYPGLRKILTATKYGVANPKVISIGLGKTAAISAAKTGGIISIVLITAYRVADYVLTDKVTLTQLIGTLATDVVKVGVVAGASIGMAALAGGMSIAIGPLAAVVIVGFGLTYALDKLDVKYKITDKVINGLEELEAKAANLIASKKQALNRAANNVANSFFDYILDTLERVAIRFVNNRLNNFTSPQRHYY